MKRFEYNFEVRYSEMDYQLTMKPAALFNILQDAASVNAEELGFGYSYVSSKNQGWFLLKYRMEFNDYPQGVYNLKVMTEPRGYNRLFAFRDFELFDGEKSLGKVASTWSMVDLETKSIVSPEIPSMPSFEKREDDLKYEKVPSLTKVDVQKEFDIRFEDIDVNGHVNNGNYIVWAFEPLSFEFRSEKKLKTLDVMFKKELKYGAKILSEIEFKDENTTIHSIKNIDTGEEVCLFKAVWI